MLFLILARRHEDEERARRRRDDPLISPWQRLFISPPKELANELVRMMDSKFLSSRVRQSWTLSATSETMSMVNNFMHHTNGDKCPEIDRM